MKRHQDWSSYVGQRYGRLLVLSVRRNEDLPAWVGECRCDCGNTKEIRLNVLIRPPPLNTTSCGCHAREVASRLHRVHGKSDSPERNSHDSMISRCYRPGNSGYSYYGGRGIGVCDRWRGRTGFSNFLFDMGTRPEGKTLDRINNDGNYEPGNCRWATPLEQIRNRRRQPPRPNCLRGHRLTAYGSGRRYCKTCRRTRDAARRSIFHDVDHPPDVG